MSFLDELINEIDKHPAKQEKAQDKLSKFYEFEKNLRELAKSKGVQPRTFLEQLVASKPELAKNKIIQKLLGEQDVPTQKGRDAKRDVLTTKAMNTVKQGIKQEIAKKISKSIRDQIKKINVSINGDTLRVSSKSKNDLQLAIKIVSEMEESLNIPLKANNFR